MKYKVFESREVNSHAELNLTRLSILPDTMQLESILITLDSLSMSHLEKRGPTDFLPTISKPRRAESPIFIAKDGRLKSPSGLNITCLSGLSMAHP